LCHGYINKLQQEKATKKNFNSHDVDGKPIDGGSLNDRNRQFEAGAVNSAEQEEPIVIGK
jgi:hypothetical protein